MYKGHKAVQITDHIWWVGALDWELTDFHGYATPHGTTYNAFLVEGEKLTLIDTVKGDKTEELLARISSFIHPDRIDYIISNHSEPDHTGALPEIIRACKPEKVFASKKGVDTLQELNLVTGSEASLLQVVKDGEELELGNRRFQFFDTKMAHWPDSMMTWFAEEGALFTNDIFGAHLCTHERFADRVDPWILDFEAKTYFANIFWPLAGATGKAVKKVRETIGLDKTQYLLPDHGPLYRDNKMMHAITDRYDAWIKAEQKSKVVVLYDTMWGSTTKIAHVIGEGLEAGGVQAVMCPMSRTHRTTVVTELLDSSGILVGSPNLNSTIFPTIADALTYAKGMKPPTHKLKGAAFGSYGWSPASIPAVEEFLQSMKVELVDSSLKTKYVPSGDAMEDAFSFGQAFAEKVKVEA